MIKRHIFTYFQNPFLRSREGSARRESTDAGAGAAGEEGEKEEAARALRRANLARSGRSLSAPGNYLTDK